MESIFQEALNIFNENKLMMYDMVALVTAVILGGIIGFEREINGKPAGLRTNILVCLGATVFTLTARHLGVNNVDISGRVMAGIVTGVGFLGAGALIQEGSGIQGLTTAASIWLVASIGVCCGIGLYHLAWVAAIIAVIELFVLLPITRRIRKYHLRSGETPLRRRTDG